MMKTGVKKKNNYGKVYCLSNNIQALVDLHFLKHPLSVIEVVGNQAKKCTHCIWS